MPGSASALEPGCGQPNTSSGWRAPDGRPVAGPRRLAPSMPAGPGAGRERGLTGRRGGHGLAVRWARSFRRWGVAGLTGAARAGPRKRGPGRSVVRTPGPRWCWSAGKQRAFCLPRMVDHAALDHPDVRGEEAVGGRLVRSGRVRTCGCGLLGLMDIVQLVHVRFQRTLTDPVHCLRFFALQLSKIRQSPRSRQVPSDNSFGRRDVRPSRPWPRGYRTAAKAAAVHATVHLSLWRRTRTCPSVRSSAGPPVAGRICGLTSV
ncbi:hypothetical protein OK006_10761 [Actinobacteria bacterium OK006]|nr:hypothetical protein OK006_10761 [Actinobacteria bacterium OK006]